MKDLMTDEQVEAEIDRLNASEDVQLARKEQRLKYKRRQYMCTHYDIWNVVEKNWQKREQP